MDLAAYLGSVFSVTVIALGAMYALTRQVGHRVDGFHDALAEFGERLSRHHPQA